MKRNKKIRIVQVIPPQLMKTGDYYYRVESPGKALSKLDDVKSVVNITTIHRNRDVLIQDADLLILYHVCDPDLIPIIIDRRNRAFPTVFEVWANINDIPSQNPLYQFWKDKDNSSLLYRLASMCDLLQFNNSGLLNLFGHLNKNSIIIPDQMSDYSTKGTDKQSDGLIIGWTGTMEDLDDLQTITPELIQWLKSHPDVKLALMAPEHAFRLFDTIPSCQKQFFTPGTMKEYYDFLKHIHIGLSPLNETPCNHGRSDRRFLEFGAFGVVPVLQDLTPYQSAEAPGGTKYLFKYPEQLSNVLDQLVSRDEFRKSIVKKAFGYVRSYRMEEGHSAQRLACYLKLFPKDNESHPVNETENQLQIALQKNPHSLKALSLMAEEYADSERFQDALQTYRELISKYPDYDLPYIKSSEILSSLGMQKEADKLRKIADDMRPGKKTKESGQGLYLIMPRGNNYGWGVCGKYLARELSGLSRLMYVTEAFSVEDVGDELDYRLLKSLIASDRDIDELLNPKSSNSNSLAVIQAIQGKNLKPWGPKLSIKKKIGYTFFEENILSHKDIEEAKDYFSLVIAGSTWCEDILRKYGLTNTKTIIQGIDPSLFNPHHNQKEYFRDSFVIFSGGKFELRKGQDLVIKAYRHFLERHEDAILIISWNNIWKSTRKSMALSKHIDFIESDEDDGTLFKKLMEINGIPLSKVIILPAKPNIAMSRIYKNTDIGLFPNRCEGGTNLVLMEYMACGKPAIASFSSGHRDIVNDKNSLILRNMGNIEIKQDQNVIAIWDDPDPDEIIEKLEYAYSNSSRLAGIGRAAGEDLSCLTWQKTAARFHQAAVEI
jgi:glycosyltransferase involved in cell wall biosynthesis